MEQNRRTEDYMKVIYRLREKGPVRGVDIAREMNVKKPTVSVALRKMESAGLICFHPDKGIGLSEKGEIIAREITERYDTLFGFLTDLGVDEHTAHEDACKMEHGVSEPTLKAIRELRLYLQSASQQFGSPLNGSEDGSL